MAYMYEEEIMMGLMSGLVSGVPSMLLGVVSYVLTAMALYTIAQRRGLNKPWLAWIPVVNCWILGSLSDQYRYVVRRENKSKRKSLLILSIISMAVGMMLTVLSVVMVFQIIGGAMGSYSEEAVLEMVLGPGLGILGLCLPLVGVSIAYTIIRYMALYDIYKSLDPGNCVLFLVLSILVGVTEPFFLFFNRNKDGGMPPRRQPEPVYQQEYQYQEDYHYQEVPPQPRQDAWEQENKDYL